MDQGFDQETVFYVNTFISGYGDFKFWIVEHITLAFQFVTPDIAFVKDRIPDTDFPQEITAGQIGMSEYKIEGMVGGVMP